jgi:hypothetical protein
MDTRKRAEFPLIGGNSWREVVRNPPCELGIGTRNSLREDSTAPAAGA